MFGGELGDLYNMTEQAGLKVNYLYQNAHKLIISRPDDRIVREREFGNDLERDVEEIRFTTSGKSRLI